MSKFAAVLRARAREDFAEAHPSHDLAHLDRVYGLAKVIAEHEGGDQDVIAAASYLHDYHRVLEKDTSGRAAPAAVAAALEDAAFPVEKRAAVLSCVATTRSYQRSGHAVEDLPIEAQIVRDADNLDAIGAIGIARAFMFGGLLEEPMWVPHEPFRQQYQAGRAPSVVHHFYEKLQHLREEMQTPTARELAAERHETLVNFLERLIREWQFAIERAETATRCPDAHASLNR